MEDRYETSLTGVIFCWVRSKRTPSRRVQMKPMVKLGVQGSAYNDRFNQLEIPLAKVKLRALSRADRNTSAAADWIMKVIKRSNQGFWIRNLARRTVKKTMPIPIIARGRKVICAT